MANVTAKIQDPASQEDKVTPKTGWFSTLFNKLAHVAERVIVVAEHVANLAGRVAGVAGRIAAFAAAAAPVVGFIAAEVAIIDLTAVFTAVAPIAPVLIGGMALAGVVGYELGKRNQQKQQKAAV